MKRNSRSKPSNSPDSNIIINKNSIWPPVNIIINKCDLDLSESDDSEESSMQEESEAPKINFSSLPKKILPERKNRGLRMKTLEGDELKEEDAFYKQVFGEANSDDDFDPDRSKLSDKDSFDTDFEKEESEKHGNLYDNSSDEQVKIIRRKKIKRKRNPIKLMKISNKEERSSNDNVSFQNQDDEIDNNDENENFSNENEDNLFDEKQKENSESESSEEIIRKVVKKKKAHQKFTKKFIDENDYNDDEYLNKKRYKPSIHLLKTKQQKAAKRQKIKQNITSNEIDKDTKVLGQFKNEVCEKPSQKDLLFEAIFTEIYNIRELENIERMEELNKQDTSNLNKKQFVDFIKTLRTVKREGKS